MCLTMRLWILSWQLLPCTCTQSLPQSMRLLLLTTFITWSLWVNLMVLHHDPQVPLEDRSAHTQYFYFQGFLLYHNIESPSTLFSNMIMHSLACSEKYMSCNLYLFTSGDEEYVNKNVGLIQESKFNLCIVIQNT